MTDRGLSDFQAFSGALRSGDDSATVSFRARIDESGEVELDFERIDQTASTRFIAILWDRDDDEVCEFVLSGQTADGIRFETESLHFSSLGNTSSASGSTFKPVGRCHRAIFRRTLRQPAPNPFVRLRLRGFENFDVLSAECPLGLVAMSGTVRPTDPNHLCGCIELQGQDVTDYSEWRSKAEGLLEYIRRIMSFAASTVLQDPVVEHYVGSNLEVITTSRTPQTPGRIRTFHFLDQGAIFETGVKTFFEPVLQVKNLFLVIEWFAIEATYNEIRLVNAMTALEMLLDSNLPAERTTIQSARDFEKKTRPFLRRAIGKCVRQLPQDRAEQIVKDMNEKLSDLNRRSLLHKLEALRQMWSVPFDGITEGMLKGAKRARDRIIHRGQYYVDNVPQEDLWRHVTVIREMLVRFILAALGYRGQYLSHLGGYHDATFPPPDERRGES